MALSNPLFQTALKKITASERAACVLKGIEVIRDPNELGDFFNHGQMGN